MRADLGDADVLIFNAGSGVWGNVEEVKAADLERAWRINTLGLFLTGRQAIPAMRRKGEGAIIVVGATASRRGAAGAAAFAQGEDGAAGARRIDGPPSLAGWNPCRAHRRRRCGRRAGDALAVHRPVRRVLHRSGRRRRDRSRSRSGRSAPPGASRSKRGRSRRSGEGAGRETPSALATQTTLGGRPCGSHFVLKRRTATPANLAARSVRPSHSPDRGRPAGGRKGMRLRRLAQ